uniref:Uncharacterized protein n=1 Tax=Anguilla anguilla TaxID=7936 RepID=A0A0E9X2A5_ANGAN
METCKETKLCISPDQDLILFCGAPENRSTTLTVFTGLRQFFFSSQHKAAKHLQLCIVYLSIRGDL